MPGWVVTRLSDVARPGPTTRAPRRWRCGARAVSAGCSSRASVDVPPDARAAVAQHATTPRRVLERLTGVRYESPCVAPAGSEGCPPEMLRRFVGDRVVRVRLAAVTLPADGGEVLTVGLVSGTRTWPLGWRWRRGRAVRGCRSTGGAGRVEQGVGCGGCRHGGWGGAGCCGGGPGGCGEAGGGREPQRGGKRFSNGWRSTTAPCVARSVSTRRAWPVPRGAWRGTRSRRRCT